MAVVTILTAAILSAGMVGGHNSNSGSHGRSGVAQSEIIPSARLHNEDQNYDIQRKKRSADHDTFSIGPRRRPRQRHSTFRFQTQGIDRFDDGGFWDDTDFDPEIFGVRNIGADPAQLDRNMDRKIQGGSARRKQGVEKVGLRRADIYFLKS